MVYRTDDASLVDWPSDLQGLTFYKARKTVSSTQVSRLQVEYLRALVQEGQLLSLPQASSVVAASSGPIRFLQERPLRTISQAASSDLFFVVIDKQMHRKKTAVWRERDSCVMPASVQRLKVVGQASSGQLRPS